LKTVIIGTLIVFVFFAGAQAIQPVTTTGGPAIGFKLQDTQGESVALNTYLGKQKVFLFFWTTWCPFCRDALQKIADLAPDLKKNGWEILAVNVQESTAKVNNFLKNRPLGFVVLLDKDGTVARAYEVMGVPTYLLIDQSGMVIYRDNYFPSEQLTE